MRTCKHDCADREKPRDLDMIGIAVESAIAHRCRECQHCASSLESRHKVRSPCAALQPRALKLTVFFSGVSRRQSLNFDDVLVVVFNLQIEVVIELGVELEAELVNQAHRDCGTEVINKKRTNDSLIQ
jgi:hypothetical protein